MAEALRNYKRVGTSLAAMVAETEAAIDSMGDTPVAEALPDIVGGVLDSLNEKFKVELYETLLLSKFCPGIKSAGRFRLDC